MSMSVKVARSKYTGDPGLGSFLGKVAGGIGGFLLGGPAGAAAGAGLAGRLLGGGSPQVPQVATPGFPGPGRGRRPPAINPPFGGPPGVGVGIPGLFGRARAGVGEQLQVPQTRNGAPPAGMKLACPSGFRPNKTSYFLKDGTFVPEGSKCVKIRRRNPMNPKALDRAISRMNSAKRLQSKLRGFSTDKYTAAGKKKC